MIDIIAGALLVACVFWMIFGAVSTYLETRPNKSEEPKFQPATPEFKCSHTWKDFPWYVDVTYYIDESMFKLKIMKPYVCIHCKERRDELLLEQTRFETSLKVVEEFEAAAKEEYSDKIMPKAIVEEQIRDMQLVDREALKIAEQLGIIKNEEK